MTDSEQQPRVRIISTASSEDSKRSIQNSIKLRTGGETITTRHPIWDYNYQYALDVNQKMEPIEKVQNIADVRRVVGYPLEEAAVSLFELEIVTLDSSPHVHPDFINSGEKKEFFAYIDIEESTLNDQNRVIAEHLVKEGIAKKLDVAYHLFDNEPSLWAYRLHFYITPTTSAEDIQKEANEAVERFEPNK